MTETGEWLDGRSTMSRTPYEQVVIASYQLERLLRTYGAPPAVYPFVVFSSMARRDVHRLPVSHDGVLCKEDLADLPSAILARVEPLPIHDGFRRQAVARLAGLLRPGRATLLPLSSELVRSDALLAAKADRVVRLTQAQTHALAVLSGNTSVGVRGPAGTGKTLVAVERAAGLAMTGHRVLYALGAGDLLADRISAEMARRKLPVDVAVGERIWKRFESSGPPDRPLSSQTSYVARYDAVILDEAQRFTDAQRGKLLATLSSVPLVYFFGDPQQALNDDAKLPSFLNTIWVDLRENCRNTIAIAGAASGFAPWVRLEADVDGPPPLVIPVADEQARAAHVGAVIRYFASEGVEPEHIAVLTTRESSTASLRAALVKAGYDPNSFAACCVAEAFIGMEARAVVVVDTARPPRRLFRWVITHQKRDLYLAITRARGLLAFITAPKTAGWLLRAGGELSETVSDDGLWHP